MKRAESERRSFLKAILTGTATAAAVIVAKDASAGQAFDQQCMKETLYRETEAFKKYYESLRS